MRNVLLIFVFGFSFVTFGNDYRAFTDKEGRTINARVIQVDTRTKKVTLERENKKKATVPISIFSEADQNYINAWSPASKDEKTEAAKAKAAPAALSKSDVITIGKEYVAACNKGGRAAASLFHESAGSVSFGFYTTSLFEKVRLGTTTESCFQIKAAFIEDPKSVINTGGTTRIGWVLLTSDGKIKYESFVNPHPMEDIVKDMLYFSRFYKGSGSHVEERLLATLKKHDIPLFGLDKSGDSSDMKDAAEDIIEWLLDNGTTFDSSDPKVFYPKKAFGSIEKSLKTARKRL